MYTCPHYTLSTQCLLQADINTRRGPRRSLWLGPAPKSRTLLNSQRTPPPQRWPSFGARLRSSEELGCGAQNPLRRRGAPGCGGRRAACPSRRAIACCRVTCARHGRITRRAAAGGGHNAQQSYGSRQQDPKTIGESRAGTSNGRLAARRHPLGRVSHRSVSHRTGGVGSPAAAAGRARRPAARRGLPPAAAPGSRGRSPDGGAASASARP